MNRHIYGLTLFLFIVKIHFLIYWAFFAPVNFFSTQDILVDNVALTELEKTSSNSADSLKAELQNIALDIKRGNLSANVQLTDLGTNPFPKLGKLRVQLFTEGSIPVWSGELEQGFTGGCLGWYAEFERSAPELKSLNSNANYYADVQVLRAFNSVAENVVYKINKTTPVLIINRKK
jgi:hypothetical protein